MSTKSNPTLNELTKGLSKLQKRAFLKLLDSGKWVSAYELQESLSTLDSLVKRRLAKIDSSRPGSLLFPRVNILYKSSFGKKSE